MAQSTSINQ